jgi:hypothetical protein
VGSTIDCTLMYGGRDRTEPRNDSRVAIAPRRGLTLTARDRAFGVLVSAALMPLQLELPSEVPMQTGKACESAAARWRIPPPPSPDLM